MKTMSQFLSATQVAEDLNVGRATVSRWIQEARIPAIKVGRNYRIPLEPYLKAKATLVQHSDPISPKISTLVADWLNNLKNGPRPFSQRTIDDYHYNLLRYLRMLGGGTTLAEIVSKEPVRRVLESIPMLHYAWRYHLISSVISFAKYAVDRTLLPEGLIKDLKALRPKRYYPPRKTVLEQDQVEGLLAAIWTMSGNSQYERHLNFAIVKTLVLTGLRNKELCDLTLGDINLKNRTIAIQLGKGAKPRQLGISKELEGVLSAFMKMRPSSASTSLFLTNRGTALTPAYVSRRIKRLAAQTGVDITPHGLRRTFVTQAALKGHSLAVISKACGHTNLSTTQGYLMLSERQVIDAMHEW